jgi:hypothetical protein
MNEILNPQTMDAKGRRPLYAGVRGDAGFVGENKEHRLWLSRKWDDPNADEEGYALWIGFMPGLEAAEMDDETSMKEQNFTRHRLRLASYMKVNALTHRGGDFKSLMRKSLPGLQLSHPENLPTILQLAEEATTIFLATGEPPTASVASYVIDVFEALHRRGFRALCLSRTDTGWPRHSARLSYKVPIEEYDLAHLPHVRRG